MKLIMQSEEVKSMFSTERPSLQDILDNRSIKQLSKGFKVIGIYIDKVNTNNINNTVIELEVNSNGN